MTFHWANIPFQWTTYSLRYHNDMLWYIWSLIQMFPIFLVAFYQLYKHFTIPNYYHKINKNAFNQRIVQFFAIPIPIYYFIDLTISIFEGSLFEPCRFCLWYHHVVLLLININYFIYQHTIT